ncbi:hypothetical protein AB4048_21225 [Rhizobium sp. RAF56]
MFGSVTRRLISVSLLAALAGCSSLGLGGDKQSGVVDPQVSAASSPAATPVAASGGYVAGKCPQVVIRDDGAVLRTYAKGAKDDPQKLVYQASLAQGTRQCRSDGTNLGITVVAQGRLVAGPMGGPGKLTLPIRVTVMDGNNTLYSDVTNFVAEIPPGETTTQFLFTNDKVSVPGGSGGYTSVYVGFDQGPAKGGKATKKK